MLLNPRSRRRSAPPPAGARVEGKGFTLIELMIALAILAILIAMAAVGWRVWILNGSIRAASGNLADNLRAARAEALQRNRRITLQLCDKSNGTSIGTVPVSAVVTLNPVGACTQPVGTGDAGLGAVGGGSGSAANPALARRQIMTSGSARIKPWTGGGGQWSVTFNSLGRVVAHPGSGAPDPSASPLLFEIDNATGATDGVRPMRVLVYESGQILVCDTKIANTDDPRACPT